jgi:flagella basal body P-ring formation protein FlgA
MEVTSLREQPVISFEQLRGYRSKRNLRKGVIITLRSIEQVPDIDVGREVSIIFDDGFCKITALGRAMHDGFVGKSIKIKSRSSGKIILAKVLDSKSVLVEI